VPRTTGLGSGRFHPASKTLTELIAPTSNRIVRHNHVALEKRFSNVAQAQLKAEVPAHRATDNLGWKAVTVIERFRFLHRATLSDHAPNLTVPGIMLLYVNTEPSHLGFFIIGIFILSWLVSVVIYRIKRYDELEAVRASP
jgi:hypothetical protein